MAARKRGNGEGDVGWNVDGRGTLEGSGRRWSDQIRFFEIFLARVFDEPLELGRPLFSFTSCVGNLTVLIELDV